MKKTVKLFIMIATALCLISAFVFSACGGETGGNNSANGGGDANHEATDTLTFEKSAAQEGYIVTGDEGQTANIVIPAEHEGEPVVGIADSAFGYAQHTSAILSVLIPDSVTEIGKNAFHNQSALASVNIGTNSKLKKIGNNAFSGNSSLQSIYLPAGLSELGDDVFNNCGALDTITVAAGNTRYSGAGNCLIDLETNTLIRGSNQSVIPETVTKIGAAAFRRATMTTLTIPKSVTSIEKYAISDSAITKVVYKGTSEEWDTLMAASSKYWNMGNENAEIVCSDAQTSHILVVYFSATGNTEKIAGYIADITGATTFELVPQNPYTADDLKYGDGNSRVSKEHGDQSLRDIPLVKSAPDNWEDYTTVFVGYPIWWGEAAWPVNGFIKANDFTGKTVVPFCTAASSDVGNSDDQLKNLAGAGDWKAGRRFFSSSAKDDVQSWIDGLNL